jgi:endonuclease YncB( thermonuclease family)
MRRTGLAALAIVSLLTACSGPNPAPSTTGAGSTSPPIAGEVATVVRVFDGDSMEVDLGGEIVEVRLLGINAPERSECHGAVARDRLRELIDGKAIVLQAEGEDADRLDRLLRTVFVSGESVNETIVAEGHALAIQGGEPAEESLTELSDRAYADRVGMWAPDACGESTPPRIRIVDVRYDPPGRDSENREEEWIVVANDSAGPVDMSGWIVRDESSTHRYQFPGGTALGAGDELRIRTGCGDDRGSDHYWCAEDAVWSNGGDTVILQTAAGTVVDRLRYAGDF